MLPLLTRRTAIVMGFLSSFFGWAKAAERRFSNIGELREYVIQILRRMPGIANARPDATDQAVIHAVYQDFEWTLNVTNLYGHLNAYPNEDVDKAITGFLSAYAANEPHQVTEDNVVAVIRSHDYLDNLRQAGTKIRHESLAGDLTTVYMIDLPDTMSPLSEHDMVDKTIEDLRRIALDNLRQWLPKIRSDETLEFCTLFYVEGNTFLSTGLILLDEFWKLIEKKFPADVLIALPRTDQLILFDASKPNVPEMARQIIEATFSDGFNLLSEKIYERRDGKFAVFSGS